MTKDYHAIANDVDKKAGQLKAAIPDAMKGFAALGAGAYPAGALPAQFKELLALVIAIAVRCDGCVAYHARSAAKKGATREEVAEAIAVAIQMGGGPSMIYAGEALAAFDAFRTDLE